MDVWNRRLVSAARGAVTCTALLSSSWVADWLPHVYLYTCERAEVKRFVMKTIFVAGRTSLFFFSEGIQHHHSLFPVTVCISNAQHERPPSKVHMEHG